MSACEGLAIVWIAPSTQEVGRAIVCGVLVHFDVLVAMFVDFRWASGGQSNFD